jgi:DNA-binding NarL/FixJ family response regulator
MPQTKQQRQNNSISILVVHKPGLFREGLSHILRGQNDFEIAAATDIPAEALRLAAEKSPDLVILEIALEGMNGLDLTKALRGRYPAMRILVLSLFNEAHHAERALRAGANGYIMKRESSAALVAAIRQVLAGQVYVSSAMNELILQKVAGGAASPIDVLSDREFEIFELIGQGFGTRQIADRLHLSMKTVESHREHIREKLDLENTFELVQRALHWIHSEDAHR